MASDIITKEDLTAAESLINFIDEFRAQIPKMAKDAIDSGSPANTIKPLTVADLEAIYERLISA